MFANILFTAEEAGASIGAVNPPDGMDYLYKVSEKRPEGASEGEDGQWTYQGVTYSDKVYEVIVHAYTDGDSPRKVVAKLINAPTATL